MRIQKLDGLPVVNARKSLTVHVSLKDIKAAKGKDPGRCAAALACVRQLGATEARIHLGRSYVRYNGKWERYTTSASLRSEVVAFDRGGKFEPGEYKLLKMAPHREMDKLRKRKTGPHNGKKKNSYHFTVGVRPVVGNA